MNGIHDTCRKAIGKNVRYKGTNGNEYDKANHGKPVEGVGVCRAYHDSHGLCIMVWDGNEELCIDPIEVQILG